RLEHDREHDGTDREAGRGADHVPARVNAPRRKERALALRRRPRRGDRIATELHQSVVRAVVERTARTAHASGLVRRQRRRLNLGSRGRRARGLAHTRASSTTAIERPAITRSDAIEMRTDAAPPQHSRTLSDSTRDHPRTAPRRSTHRVSIRVTGAWVYSYQHHA